jgi:hypothetical protein
MSKRVLLFVFTVILATQVIGQTPISNIQLNKKMPVLNGRAYFNFPALAYSMQRAASGLSPAPNPNEETRVIYDTGKMRIVFFVQELYLLGDKNLLNEVENDNAYKKNFTSKEFIATDSLYAILSSPVKYDSLQSAIMINSLLVQTADGTLFRVDAYVDSAAFIQKAQFKSLSEKVFGTLTSGPRRNAYKARMEEYPLADSTLSLHFRLPDNYCITVDRLYDFEFFKIHKYRNFKDTTWMDISINIGGQQNYTYMNYGLYKQDAIIDSSCMLFGKPVEWMVYKDNWHGIYLKEQVISNDNNIAPHLSVHISMVSNSQAKLSELSQLVEAIELRRK